MIFTIHIILILLFFVCEFLAAMGVSSKVNLEAAGLTFFALSLLIMEK